MNVAFIPVRGGSKTIPLKNIKTMYGHPLVYWALKAACECKYIDEVYVATDNEKIKQAVVDIKQSDAALFQNVEVIARSEESATDTASTEFAMLEFTQSHDFDSIVLIQATSPLLRSNDLKRGFEAYHSSGTDSVLSVVEQKRFIWNNNDQGYAVPQNYDIFHRPRRQEFDGYLVENGAFYITSREKLIASRNRVSGNIKAVIMEENTYYEIDTMSDWTIVEQLLKKQENLSVKIPLIKLFLTDCDGCLTDGGMYYSENGDELKKFNTRDSYGFTSLQANGIKVGVITGEDVQLNLRRFKKLGLDFYYAGIKDKLSKIFELCAQIGISIENVAYVGDDINDLEVIRAVGYGCCVKNAIKPVREAARYISPYIGGEGAIRDVAEHILLSVHSEYQEEKL